MTVQAQRSIQPYLPLGVRQYIFSVLMAVIIGEEAIPFPFIIGNASYPIPFVTVIPSSLSQLFHGIGMTVTTGMERP